MRKITQENFTNWFRTQLRNKNTKSPESYITYLKQLNKILNLSGARDIEHYISIELLKDSSRNESAILKALSQEIKAKQKLYEKSARFSKSTIDNISSAINKLAEYYEKTHKQYQTKAKIVIPYLVRYAKARKSIYYSELAKLINLSNPRNLNYILGEIGILFDTLKYQIPLLQSLVINKTSKLPSDGIRYFLPNYDQLSKDEKKNIAFAERQSVFDYRKWDQVLKDLGLATISIPNSNIDSEGIPKGGFGGGESSEHKHLKQFIANNPNIVGANSKFISYALEYQLDSGDIVDTMFVYKNTYLAIESKSKISNEEDIRRGLFQCIKYKAVLDAMLIVQNKQPISRVVLALESPLPTKLNLIKDLLGVEVVDNIGAVKGFKN